MDTDKNGDTTGCTRISTVLQSIMMSLKLSDVLDGVFLSELPMETKTRSHDVRERLAVVLAYLRCN